jgi:RNA polymerase sigma-70 factor (ECF subfamily)
MIDQGDERLVQQCIQGDNKAFEALVEKYQRPMFNVALRIINDYEDAADITQAAFVKAYESLRQFDSRYKFYSWLYRITVNGSLNFINGRRRFEGLDEGIVSPEKSADEVFSDQDTSRTVEEALMKLSPDYRVVIVLSHFNDLSYREISDVLGIPEKRVKSRLFTARQLLKSLLINKGV